MSRSQSPYSRRSGGVGQTSLLPLEDVPSGLLREPYTQRGYSAESVSPAGGGAPRGSSDKHRKNSSHFTSSGSDYPQQQTQLYAANSPPPVVTSATADFQRSLVQQQLQQAQRDTAKLKEELYDTSGRLSQVTTKLNEQKVEYGALTHRYANTIEKLTNAESDLRKLEEQLVQERTRGNRLREEGDELKLQLRSANEDVTRLQRELSEKENSRGLDKREVQRLLEDRSRYVPTLEAQRMQAELRDAQQSLVDRLARALEALSACGEEEETNLFVARSAVLSAATDLEARTLHAEGAVEHLVELLRHYQEGLEGETNDFLLALMAENKELWHQLTTLQSEHDVAVSELALERRRGESVPADQHQYVQRQLENMTERLQKAQQVMSAQTALAREHEKEMQELIANNAELEEKVAQLTRRLSSEETNRKDKSKALEAADTALKDATGKIQSLQEALVAERESADDTVRKLSETQNTMQCEFEQRVRTLQSERATLEERTERTEKSLEEARLRVTTLEKEVAARTQSFDQLKSRVEESAARQQQLHETDMAQAQQAMERELSLLHQRLEEAQQEARAAVRERDDRIAEAQTLRSTVTALETELSRQRNDMDESDRQVSELQTRLRTVVAERDELRSQYGTSGLTAAELEKQIAQLQKERAEVVQQLKGEQQRGQERYEQAQKDWRAAEKARVNLQEELKLLRSRLAEVEMQRQSHDRSLQDREHLMQENLRLHDQYAVVQRENSALSEELKAIRQKGQSSAQLQQQLQDLQNRLRELPQLRKAADDGRREALKAREETEVLRKERDDMATRLDYFLEESKVAAQMDEAFDRAVRDAGETVKRLGGQVQSAKARGTQLSSYPPQRTQSPSKGAGGTASSGLAAAVQQQQQQQQQPSARDASLLTVEAAVLDRSSLNTPQRPWKA